MSIRKFIDDKFEDVGNIINNRTIINDLEFYGNSIIVNGANYDNFISDVYFLNSENKWTVIPTSYFFIDLINFNGKLLAATADGKIFELSSN